MEKNTKKEKGRGKGIKREFSAGGVVFKKENNDYLWLIIKPKGTDRWQFPKGKIDKNESSKKAALREVSEEGGVETKLVDRLGKSQYFFVLKGKKIFKTVTYFLLEYKKGTKAGHDWEVDDTEFVKFQKAHELLTFKEDREMLEKAKESLASGTPSQS